MILKNILGIIGGIAVVFSVIACDNAQQSVASEKDVMKKETVKKDTENEKSPYIVKGKVLETKDASGYTYLRLSDDVGNEIWAAIPETALTVGEVVTLEQGSVMTNFKSKAFDRTFETIIFASGVAKEEVSKKVEEAEKYHVEPGSGGSAGNVMAMAGVKVDKATGSDAYTVLELFENASNLHAKPVTVKGKVVKVSNQIMGKNWLHLQDGTGDPAKKTHDLVVTTAETAEVGDLVTLKGTVAANKDFGYGYKYDVLVEDAVVVK